ncbi:MAG: nucleotidyl transferase AbiEii/AbiGii toxin family protein [bacterium]|nr:nucleotidyl transferase AbiEii/AbiGii toxin family protein [bacterium]
MHPEALTNEGKGVFNRLSQFAGFYLAGGTGLALQLGHRVSVDFDLFNPDYILPAVLPKAKRVFEEFSLSPIVNNPDELSVLINGIKLTFLRYPFPVLESLVEYEGVKILSVSELAATKAYTIGRRGSFKDYADLFFVISEGSATLESIMSLAENKYGADFNSRLFLEQLVYLEDVEEVELIFLKKPVSKKEIENFFINEVKNINLD